jgi:methionyl-tRNA synthetase
MANRYFDGERPSPGPEAGMAKAWAETLAKYGDKLEGCLLHDALGALWDFVGAANRLVDAEQPWSLAKAMKNGDAEAGVRLRAVLGDLVEACRLISLAVAPFIPTASPRALTQLGYDYAYAADGNGGPALLDELRWGAHAAEAGRLATAEPLFPRIEMEAATPPAG